MNSTKMILGVSLAVAAAVVVYGVVASRGPVAGPQGIVPRMPAAPPVSADYWNTHVNF